MAAINTQPLQAITRAQGHLDITCAIVDITMQESNSGALEGNQVSDTRGGWFFATRLSLVRLLYSTPVATAIGRIRLYLDSFDINRIRDLFLIS